MAIAATSGDAAGQTAVAIAVIAIIASFHTGAYVPIAATSCTAVRKAGVCVVVVGIIASLNA